MNWTTYLETFVAKTFASTVNLIEKVDDHRLDWKPHSDNNWMTTGQLLKHLSTACGFNFKGFVTGDWGLPPGVDMSDLPTDEMLPPAEKMPTIDSVAACLEALETDRILALDMIHQAGEESLQNTQTAAPWDPTNTNSLGWFLAMMCGHLSQHRDQLFYYLKLQGKSVNTMDLYAV